jgi:hypothetical protein
MAEELRHLPPSQCITPRMVGEPEWLDDTSEAFRSELEKAQGWLARHPR